MVPDSMKPCYREPHSMNWICINVDICRPFHQDRGERASFISASLVVSCQGAVALLSHLALKKRTLQKIHSVKISILTLGPRNFTPNQARATPDTRQQVFYMFVALKVRSYIMRITEINITKCRKRKLKVKVWADECVPVATRLKWYN